MAENRGFDFLDILVIIAKWKKMLAVLTVLVCAASYLFVYFGIEKQYDSTVMIMPVEQEQIGGLNSLLKNFSAIPSSITGMTKGSALGDLFKAVIYSRTALDTLIVKFNLMSEYKMIYWERTREILVKNISVDDKETNSIKITVRSGDPQKSAEMANFLLSYLNRTVIELNVKKSKENRLFLENRVEDIKLNLQLAEDSLKLFQQKSGVLLAEQQAKSTIEALTKLEADLAAKETEYAIIKKLYGESTPQANSAKLALEEFKKTYSGFKNGTRENSPIVAYNALPAKGLEYVRLLRNVEIYNSMLKFIIPLYEQSRFEEQKDVPVFQVIDKALPAEYKSYPPRAMYSIVMAFGIMAMLVLILILKEILGKSENERVKFLLSQIPFRRKIN